MTLEEETERCRLHFDPALMKGKWRLKLAFTGTLNDKLRGFYRSKYKNKEGDWRWLAATQFEATDARRAFPCWDEPAFKAVFSSTLVVDPALQVVSNTAVAEERAENGKKVVRFADTIPMSTYLVAFIVGELEATDPAMVGQTPLRAWCVPGKKGLTAFGREIGAFSLGLYEEYYGRKYPGDKLDLIAIPDFAAGAMENLGAITFRETALLVDEATATHAERERVADVVAHENAHMWFGDLVTMGWWNGLWLNEAFATFMEMMAVDAWKPEWKRWTTFGVSRSVGPGGGRPAQHAAHRVPGRGAERRRRHVRRAHLRKGRVGAADARTVHRPGGLPRWRPPLPRPPRLRQHRDGRPLVRPRRGVAIADPRGDGRLDFPSGLSADRRAEDAGGPRRAAAAALPLPGRRVRGGRGARLEDAGAAAVPGQGGRIGRSGRC